MKKEISDHFAVLFEIAMSGRTENNTQLYNILGINAAYIGKLRNGKVNPSFSKAADIFKKLGYEIELKKVQ